ncbi:MAG: EAL domain-containing protein, partial [Clostridia bacterium]|nr:EAL domain-containing protein [Clostridia bacterium]
ASMIDRAMLAQDSVRGNAVERSACYNESMRFGLLRQQALVGDMETALREGQFLVWLQPQYNQVTCELVSAEALVRWQHPARGMIPPDEFIPVFERNGFITKLDAFVWEEVCRLLRRWRDAGLPAVPVSVNISMVDVLEKSLLSTLTALTDKYGVPHWQLRLEITESAYASHPEHVVHTVRALQAAGFFVEMDDFGKGYSSLNSLKDIPVNLLKLDMRFLGSSEETGRSGLIIASVMRMAHWLNLPVIAEGVETLTQASYLKTIGCTLVQGYFFARPMPASEFETLLSTEKTGSCGPDLEIADFFNSKGMWDPNALDSLIFNSIMSGAGILECCFDNVEVLRLNDQYYETTGISREEQAAHNHQLLNLIVPEDRPLFLRALREAHHSGLMTQAEIRWQAPSGSGPRPWICVHVRRIARSRDRFLVYVTFENRTEQKNIELREHTQNERARLLLENTGLAMLDYDPALDRLELNDKHKAADAKVRTTVFEHYLSDSSAASMLHDEDRPAFRALLQELSGGGESRTLELRANIHGAGYRWCRLQCFAVPSGRGGTYRVIGLASNIQQEKDREALISTLSERLRLKTPSAYDAAIVEAVFQMLYDTEDIDEAVRAILSLLGEHYRVDRAYIFEDTPDHLACNNTYEWCAEGVEPQIDQLQ